MSSKPAIVVDDNSANRDFLERLMVSAGFDVEGASTGKETLDIAEQHSELKLALVDMELPDMNGIQLTAALRARFPDAYIIVATMHDDFSLIEAVFSKGGNVFLVKPHGFMELYKRLVSTDLAVLRTSPCMVIDQYGPRPFESSGK